MDQEQHYFLPEDEAKWKMFLAYKISIIFRELNSTIQSDKQILGDEGFKRRKEFLESQVFILSKFLEFFNSSPLYLKCLEENMTMETTDIIKNSMCDITGENNAQLKIVLKRTN
jgi:hypothetical protein